MEIASAERVLRGTAAEVPAGLAEDALEPSSPASSPVAGSR